ncbi:uncharacterized protein LOC143575264 [Bidens hawaiensis]|uniref:uncharacterized protein LOC143575264 n=1 Tax=Bidens hawaiensis TaxID=980011 RepID=UPI0040493052
MEQQTPTPPPPSLTTTAAATTYPESIDSSPRSLTTDSWGEDNSLHPPTNGTANPAAGVTKLRLMCSSGGHIVPRPHDKSLTYVGGDTRIVVVDRHTTLQDLTHRLSKTLLRSSPTTSFTVKYQLPTEDLDSLISVTTDEDLENMIEEYERINSVDVTKSSRIRLFLFPTKPESGSSIGSILESSTKSEDWFLSALNGTTSFSDTSSVNCLLSLDDEVLAPEKKDVVGKNMKGNNNNSNSGQDVHLVPDLERTSSFGSASSAPSLANLPPIKVHVDDNQVKGIEEQLTQMSVQQPAPVLVATGVSSSSTPVAPDTVFSEGRQKQAVIYQDQVLIPSDNNNRASDPNSVVNIPDQNTRSQIQQVTDSAYVMSMPNPQIDPQHPQMHHQQPQFIVPPPQYIHHHPSGAVPLTSYYQVYPSQSQHHPPIDHQNFVYYVPARPAPHGYNLQMQHHTTGYAEVSSAAATAAPLPHSQPPPSVYSTSRTAQTAAKSELPSQYVQVPSSQHQPPPQFVGYSQIHHPTQPVANPGAGYGYEFTEPAQGQAIYYAAQPLPPHQTVTSESGAYVPPDNNVKQQQGRTQQA